MFEKGGMKKVIGQGSSVTASTRNIMADEFYGHLGGILFLGRLLTLKRVSVQMRLWM